MVVCPSTIHDDFHHLFNSLLSFLHAFHSHFCHCFNTLLLSCHALLLIVFHTHFSSSILTKLHPFPHCQHEKSSNHLHAKLLSFAHFSPSCLSHTDHKGSISIPTLPNLSPLFDEISTLILTHRIFCCHALATVAGRKTEKKQ